jgi:hypothetical protein
LDLISLIRLAVALGGYAYCCGVEECPAPQPAPAVCPCPPRAERVHEDVLAPALYVVSVRQTGDKSSTISWPKVALANGSHCFVAAQMQDGKGKPFSWGLHVRHLGTEDGMARLDLSLRGGSKKYHSEVKAPLGKEVTVALGGDTAEPLCVGVRVDCKPGAKGQSAPMAACSVPQAAQAPMLKPHVLMPPPLPVASPVMAFQPMMPPPMPVSTVEAVPAPCVGTYNVLPFPAPVPQAAVTMPYPNQPVSYPVLTPPPVPSFTPVGYHAAAPGKTVRLVKEDGRPKVQVHGPMGVTRAVRMTTEDGPCGKLSLSAGERYVHVSGHDWKAQAGHVEVTPDGRVVLSGNVKLTCSKLGDGVSVSGSRVCIVVKGGYFVELVTK